MHCVIAIMKYEGNNLTYMVTKLHSIIDYHDMLKLQNICESICFNHIMFKACYYVAIDENETICLKDVNLKIIHCNLYETIMRTKK
jgi:hypothetical protein